MATAVRKLITYADLPCGRWRRALLLLVSSRGGQQQQRQQSWAAAAAAAARRRPTAIASPIRELAAECRHALRELMACAATSDQLSWAAARRQPPAVTGPIKGMQAEWRPAVRKLMAYAGMPCRRWWRALLLLVSSHGEQQQQQQQQHQQQQQRAVMGRQQQQQPWAAAAAAAARRRPTAIASPIKELAAEWRHVLRELMTYADMPCGSQWRALLLPISSHGQQQGGSHLLSSALLRRWRLNGGTLCGG